MRIVRYQTGDGEPRCGWIQEDMVGEIEGDLFGKYMRREAKTPVSDVKLLAPIVPSKIICVGRNYVEHAKELGNDVPKIPLIFLKPPSSILGPGEAIILPPQSKQVEHEAELVVVIGKRGRNITAEQAADHVLGYTVGNDVTARDLQKTDDQWTRAKGFDTFCPFGPWIDTEFDISDAVITSRVNDQPTADGVHAGRGVRRPDADRVHLVGDDAGAGGPDLHRHAGGRRPAQSRGRSRGGDRGARRAEKSRASGEQIGVLGPDRQSLAAARGRPDWTVIAGGRRLSRCVRRPQNPRILQGDGLLRAT